MEVARACLASELSPLINAANQVFRPTGGDMGRDYPLLFDPNNLSGLRVISDAAGVIAHAGLCVRTVSWGDARHRVGAIGAVFTRADCRGRGLGATVVADALAWARAADVALVLVSGDGPLYRRLGFVPAPLASCWTWPRRRDGSHDKPGESQVPPASVQVRPLGEADLTLAARLNDAEPIHFERDAGDWGALWRASVISAWPARLWVVEEGAGPVGYLAVAQRARRRVLELAGARAALLAAAPLVCDELAAPGHDLETAHHARALGWNEAPLGLGVASQWLEPPAPASPLPLPLYGLNYV